MVNKVYGAFTLLIVVNGQDVRVQCSLCGTIRRDTVDRSVATEAALQLHISSHIHYISQRSETYNPVRPPIQED
jgi:hypothetical protein